MAYFEGEIPTVVSGNGYNNGGMFGNDGWWGIILIALLFGWGRGGYGGNYGGASGEGAFGYQLGKLATTNDVASGFSTSEIMSDLNDIILGQNTGFANVQQTLCQGFNGINTAILQSANATERGFANLGYNLASCCCELKGSIADVKYANERNTCDIINAINAGNQRLVDIYTTDKINALTAENVALKGKISDDFQADRIIGALAPKQPIPAYPVFPTTSFAYPSGVTFGVGNNNGCGCGNVF